MVRKGQFSKQSRNTWLSAAAKIKGFAIAMVAVAASAGLIAGCSSSTSTAKPSPSSTTIMPSASVMPTVVLEDGSTVTAEPISDEDRLAGRIGGQDKYIDIPPAVGGDSYVDRVKTYWAYTQTSVKVGAKQGAERFNQSLRDNAEAATGIAEKTTDPGEKAAWEQLAKTANGVNEAFGEISDTEQAKAKLSDDAVVAANAAYREAWAALFGKNGYGPQITAATGVTFAT